MNLVADSSVIIKWFVRKNEHDRKQALLLKDHFLQGRYALIVPDLILYEVSNVLRNQKEVKQGNVEKMIKLLFTYPFRITWPANILLIKASQIAYSHNLSVYDAVYLALAKEIGCPFVTADKKLQIRQEGINVCLLKDFKSDSN